MIKLIRNNQKKVLAGLTIFSMIGFLVNRGNGTKDGTTDRKVGTIEGKTLYESEVAESRACLSALQKYVDFRPDEGNPTQQSRFNYVFATRIEHEKPELFMLLRHEANELGIQANEDDVQKYLKHNTSPELQPDTDEYSAVAHGLADMLKILSRFQHLTEADKVSQPQLDRQLAMGAQLLEVKLVQLKALDYLAAVPPPTTQQLQSHFMQYTDNNPNQATPANPFGFGYRLKQRVKLEYVRVTNEAVTNAVLFSKDPYSWDVEAHKYYYKHLDTLPRAVGPSTRPAGPESFEAAEAGILTSLRDPLIAAKRDEVTRYISVTLNNDYQAYSRFLATNPNGTVPDSSLGVPYSSFRYLVKLDESTRAKFNVEISPDATSDYLTQDAYSTLRGVGSAAVTDFITEHATDYLKLADSKDPTAAAALMEPSTSLKGPEDKSQIFVRLTNVLPSQPPADITPVVHQVEDDFRLSKAYQMAKDQAAALLIAAKAGSLDTAALAAGHPVIPGDTDINYSTSDVKGVIPPLADTARSFVTQVFKLLDMYDPKLMPHPAITVELPELPNSRLFVAQLQSVHTIWKADSFISTVAQVLEEDREAAVGEIALKWFNLDATKARLNYIPIKGN